jgi:hypothetical protein
VPFPRTERERQASGDPRVSLEARYADRAAYEAKVRSAAIEVVGRGFLLPEDVDALVAEAGVSLKTPVVINYQSVMTIP